jgi:hypothetical protein
MIKFNYLIAFRNTAFRLVAQCSSHYASACFKLSLHDTLPLCLIVTWMRMWKLMYISASGWPWHWLEASDQLQVSPSLHSGREAMWTSVPVWALWRRENCWPYRESNCDPSVVQPVGSRDAGYRGLCLHFALWTVASSESEGSTSTPLGGKCQRCVRFVVETVALGTFSFNSLDSPANPHSNNAPYSSTICVWYNRPIKGGSTD